MDDLISVCNLTKRYGKVLAVDDICFGVKKGSCFGLLGPNGAGKTTTIEIMEGILKANTGQVYYLGKPVDSKFKEKVGIQFQYTSIQDYLTVRDTLLLFASLYNKNKPLDEVIELCSLSDIIDRDTRKLSGGQKQRMLLALAIINDPELLFLDEPTTGLDPQARRNFWQLINNIKAENKTVILTTHYMDEAEKLCDEIAIMDHGKILAIDTPQSLIEKNFDGVFVQLPIGDQKEKAASLPFKVEFFNKHFQFMCKDVDSAIKELMDKKIPLSGLEIKSPNLEDLFLKFTGTNLRS